MDPSTMPRPEALVAFFQAPRAYRGQLTGLDQGLLDALVTASLGRDPAAVLDAPRQLLWMAHAQPAGRCTGWSPAIQSTS